MFVHARNATVRTAMGLIEMAKNHGEICFFQPDQGSDYGQCEKQVRGLSSDVRNRNTADFLLYFYLTAPKYLKQENLSSGEPKKLMWAGYL